MLRSKTFLFVLVFGVSFTLLSIPFITGMMRPTFSEKNPYALFYAFFNFPVTLLLGSAVASLSRAVWDAPTVEQHDMMGFAVSLVFWSLLGGVIGWIKDVRGGKV